MTVHGDTARMPGRRHNEQDAPLASYVLRITGRPAVLRFELHDVRTGERFRFARIDSLAAFLRERGLDWNAAVGPVDDGAR